MHEEGEECKQVITNNNRGIELVNVIANKCHLCSYSLRNELREDFKKNSLNIPSLNEIFVSRPLKAKDKLESKD